MRYLNETDDAATKIVEVIGDIPPSLAWCCTPCLIKESQPVTRDAARRIAGKLAKLL